MCHDANVAQVVEQMIRNQQVMGSSPIISSIKTPLVGVFIFPTPCGRSADVIQWQNVSFPS